eukprot:gene5795-5720_t
MGFIQLLSFESASLPSTRPIADPGLLKLLANQGGITVNPQPRHAGSTSSRRIAPTCNTVLGRFIPSSMLWFTFTASCVASGELLDVTATTPESNMQF